MAQARGPSCVAVCCFLALVPGCSSDDLARTSTTVGGAGGAAGASLGAGAAQGGATPRALGTSGYASSTVGGASYVEPVEIIDLNALPTSVPRVALEVAAPDLAVLEANPFDSASVLGAYVDAVATRHEPVDVNYRGAYALQSLINSGRSQRNWKVKFPKDQTYQNRREWNLTYETHVRQKLAYDLMRFAGVKVPSAEHVRLSVNGVVSGVYLKYEDPDNKDFLADKFGDNSGDLYKAAYDMPDRPRYFATLEYLGDSDTDYELHYRKMTNNDIAAKALDYSSLRGFLKGLNETSDDGFEAFLRQYFDADKFVSYLVVANFMSHWDSYPQRPKNFWLYQVPATGRWVYIPWDMDATFQNGKWSLNPMGSDASVFYQFDGFVEYSGRLPEEGTARPLVTRMMHVPSFRAAYVARYREALGSFLGLEYLLARVDALSALISPDIVTEERKGFVAAQTDMKNFIRERTVNVTAELAAQP